MQTWRPLVDARGRDDKAAADHEIAQVEQSITDLRTRLSTASQQMARVRTGGTVTPQGLRDYAAAGGDRGRDYQTFRRLSYEYTELVADSRGNHEVVHLGANEEAWVEIPTWLLRIDP